MWGKDHSLYELYEPTKIFFLSLPQLINMTIIMYIYILFSMYGSAYGCVRQYEYHSTLPHKILLPSVYDLMID